LSFCCKEGRNGEFIVTEINIRKMHSVYQSPIQYTLEGENEQIQMNSLLGETIKIYFEGIIHCVVCGKKITKTFAQGSCYDCFRNASENSECIIRPELCRAHEGKGRDPAWEEKNHNVPHYVYLALSSAVKVGVTSRDQIPTRWIDQGASEGLILAECPNRFHAGELEVFLKDSFTDRTNWQRMLKNQVSPESLVQAKEKLAADLMEPYSSWVTDHKEALVLEYPVLEYPEKVKSLKLDRDKIIEAVLMGIKGQYLLFQGGQVLNVRAHSGYRINLDYS
jgi:hypothetical protein